jgi:hypothetical protein
VSAGPGPTRIFHHEIPWKEKTIKKERLEKVKGKERISQKKEQKRYRIIKHGKNKTDSA